MELVASLAKLENLLPVLPICEEDPKTVLTRATSALKDMLSSLDVYLTTAGNLDDDWLNERGVQVAPASTRADNSRSQLCTFNPVSSKLPAQQAVKAKNRTLVSWRAVGAWFYLL
jgi:hypothetical protein